MQSLIEELLNDNEGYNEARSNQNIIVYAKIGSILMPNLLIIKASIQLGSEFEMKDVAEVLVNPEQRESWDSSLVESHTLRVFNKNLLTKKYVVKIPIPLFQDREYVEKQIVFSSDDNIFIYISSVDDLIEPLKTNLTRARTIISGTKLTQKDKNIQLQAISQMDTKLPFPPTFVINKMVNVLEKFRVDFINKLKSINS